MPLTRSASSFKVELRTVGNFNKEVRSTKGGGSQIGVNASNIPYFKLSFTMIPVNYRQELAFVIWAEQSGQMCTSAIAPLQLGGIAGTYTVGILGQLLTEAR